MCGRYFLPKEDEDDRYPKLRVIIEEINRGNLSGADKVHRGEIFPSQIAPVILAAAGGYTVRPMRWGFPRGGGAGLVINSRSEKAETTPMFQKAAREGRCLVPMGGFYEWRRRPDGAKTKDKFAFSLGNVPRGELMYAAGLYGRLAGGSPGDAQDCFVILTQAADGQMSPYHDRMPVLLREESLKKAWLAPSSPYQALRPRFLPPSLQIDPVPAPL